MTADDLATPVAVAAEHAKDETVRRHRAAVNAVLLEVETARLEFVTLRQGVRKLRREAQELRDERDDARERIELLERRVAEMRRSATWRAGVMLLGPFGRGKTK